MKVIAVIVTYNRLELLKKCLNAVYQQAIPPDEIIVINNGSTDNTKEWLIEQPLILYSQENIGGAGGFSFGINMAYKHGADWIWVMDDDTIPEKDALKELLFALKKIDINGNKIGFLSSNVLWSDGTAHEINKTYQLYDEKKLGKLSIKSSSEFPLIQFGTFVSMLLSAKAVEKVGLPIKDFFIWSDDVEYSKRIINYGLAGVSVKKSVAIHETPINHISSVFKDTPAQLWKYGYGLRNELYTKRLHDGEMQFWVTWVHRMFIMPFRIAINRKDNKWAFTKVVWKTSLNAINFRPVIEKVG